MSPEALKLEAERLKIDYNGKTKRSVQQEIIKRWQAEMRQSLQDCGIDDSTVNDEDIESFYNLFLSVK